MKHVGIIGGGFAGLAAGVCLANQGFRVTVLEGRPRLGGRAYSFRDDETGAILDNGQHAMMGCYKHTLAFLRRIGAERRLTRQRDLHVPLLHPQLGAGSICCPLLPAPFHIIAGVLRYRLLTRAERWSALRAGLRLMWMRRRHDPQLAHFTVEQLLVALGESENARRSFWYPVAIATLNESPERAAAVLFAEVVARAFFASRRDSQFVLPKVGLSELYTEDARRFIELRKGNVELKTPVESLSLSGGRVVGVLRRNGHCTPVDACISAVPAQALASLLPLQLRAHPSVEHLGAFEPSPIVSVHLWFDRPLVRDDFVGLLGTTTHWLFNRTKLGEEPTANGTQRLSAVISAARQIVDWDPARITDTVAADIRMLIPEARAARMLRAVVVKEKQATISPTPASERLRPGPKTPIDNCFLAGDWTDTGLPPTIESAVASGERAAALAAERLRGHQGRGSSLMLASQKQW